jgi:hypothetical protein
MMDKEELKELRKDVISINWLDLEETMSIASCCFFTYINSMIAFGKESEVTKDVINIWKEVSNLLKEERYLLNLIFKYSKFFDINQVEEYIYDLGMLNEQTIKYYLNLLDSIGDACETQSEYRATRTKKDFNTLLDNNDYREKLCSLLLNENDIKEFLNYPDEFWKYVDERTTIVDSYFEEEKEFYGVNIKTNNNCIDDMKVFVPEIINLETALVNVHEYTHAYNLYEILGKEMMSDLEYENLAKLQEEKFVKEQIPKKYQKIFKK